MLDSGIVLVAGIAFVFVFDVAFVPAVVFDVVFVAAVVLGIAFVADIAFVGAAARLVCAFADGLEFVPEDVLVPFELVAFVLVESLELAASTGVEAVVRSFTSGSPFAGSGAPGPPRAPAQRSGVAMVRSPDTETPSTAGETASFIDPAPRPGTWTASAAPRAGAFIAPLVIVDEVSFVDGLAPGIAASKAAALPPRDGSESALAGSVEPSSVGCSRFTSSPDRCASAASVGAAVVGASSCRSSSSGLARRRIFSTACAVSGVVRATSRVTPAKGASARGLGPRPRTGAAAKGWFVVVGRTSSGLDATESASSFRRAISGRAAPPSSRVSQRVRCPAPSRSASNDRRVAGSCAFGAARSSPVLGAEVGMLS